MFKLLKQLNKMLMRPLSLLENKYIAGGVKLFVVLYAARVAPSLPMMASRLLMNSVIKMLVLFLIIYTGIKDPMMSLLISIGFVLAMRGLRELEQAQDIKQVLNVAVNVPQSLINEVIDGAQELVEKASEKVGGPVPAISGSINSAVDVVQDLGNSAINSVQSAVL